MLTRGNIGILSNRAGHRKAKDQRSGSGEWLRFGEDGAPGVGGS